MAEITFYHSVMGAGKSTYALQLNHSLKQAGFNPVLMKPKMDTRDVGVIRSRIGIEHECIEFTTDGIQDRTHVIVDEAQFLDEAQAMALAAVADCDSVPVYCFGLRTSYTGVLFEGSAAMLAIADNIVELPLIYKDGNKAIMHIRYVNDKPVFEGVRTIVGDLQGVERYESVSRAEYFRARRSSLLDELIDLDQQMGLWDE